MVQQVNNAVYFPGGYFFLASSIHLDMGTVHFIVSTILLFESYIMSFMIQSNYYHLTI